MSWQLSNFLAYFFFYENKQFSKNKVFIVDPSLIRRLNVLNISFKKLSKSNKFRIEDSTNTFVKSILNTMQNLLC